MRALSEIGGMVQRAAHGAGIPLGQAEDLGRIAIYLARTDGPLSCISEALAEPMTPLDVNWTPDRITVASGPSALAAPVIRDAFAMGVTRAELPDTKGTRLVQAALALAGYVVAVSGPVLTLKSTVAPLTPVGPVTVPDDIWQVWSDYAQKTYVPDSDASRVKGAGAGMTDND